MVSFAISIFCIRLSNIWHCLPISQIHSSQSLHDSIGVMYSILWHLTSSDSPSPFSFIPQWFTRWCVFHSMTSVIIFWFPKSILIYHSMIHLVIFNPFYDVWCLPIPKFIPLYPSVVHLCDIFWCRLPIPKVLSRLSLHDSLGDVYSISWCLSSSESPSPFSSITPRFTRWCVFHFMVSIVFQIPKSILVYHSMIH